MQKIGQVTHPALPVEQDASEMPVPPGYQVPCVNCSLFRRHIYCLCLENIVYCLSTLFTFILLPGSNPHRGAQRAYRQPQPRAGGAPCCRRFAEQLGEEKQVKIE